VRPHATANRILVYRPGQIGDTLIALPALWAIRNHFAFAHLCLLTDRHSHSNFVLASQVLPEGLFDNWLTYPADQEGVSTKVFPALLREIRAGCFDTLVYLAPRNRSRAQVWRDLSFFQIAGIRHILAARGVEPLPRGENGSLPVVTHEADHLLDRLALSGLVVPPSGSRRIDLRLTDAETGRADYWLSAAIGLNFSSKRLVAVGPGSKWPSKVWPEERYLELGERLIERWGIYPIIFGGPEDRKLGERLIERWGTGANAAGELNVREAAAAMSRCILYVGNDTGTMHLAAAAGVPCVAIFAAVDWPGRWAPYGERHIVLRRAVACEGCRLRVCAEREMECLRRIEVADALAAVERQLAELQQN
jgi:ADP-heptose:LPS heptosyltransferase